MSSEPHAGSGRDGSNECVPEGLAHQVFTHVAPSAPDAGSGHMTQTSLVAPTVNSTIECLDLCDRVAGMLKAIGFRHAYTSMRSEACYYAMPGFSGLLRLATHKNKKANQRWEGRPVVAKLTFTTSTSFKSEVHFIDHVAKAVGRYMLAHVLQDHNVNEGDDERP